MSKRCKEIPHQKRYAEELVKKLNIECQQEI